MSDLIIPVSLRAERGRHNKKIRKNKLIPAVVYGPKQKAISVSLDIRMAEKYSKKQYENKLFTFESTNKDLKGLKVIKKSIVYHKCSRLPIHMDFLSLDMKKPIRVQVEIDFQGLPKGVKEENGVFNITLRSVEVECLPGEIPPSISLDVSGLTLNQNLHVSDLKIPENLKLITKLQRTLCIVSMAKEEEVKTEATTDKPVAKEEDSEEASTTPTEKKASNNKPKTKK